MIELKTGREIEKMRAAGQILAKTLDLIEQNLKPGMTTEELDKLADGFIRTEGATPAFLGYNNYPKSICVSIDDEVIHGIPSPSREIRDGQVVSVDAGVLLDGFYADSARTFAVGEIPNESRKLLEVTRTALQNGISQARRDSRLGDVSYAVQQTAESAGYGVVRDLVGHGIGRKLHEEPQVPNYGSPSTGVLLKVGMVLAIEPMVNLGGFQVRTKPDGWTVVTADGSISAHFEHTVAITEGGPVVLTI
jgi:methionyl aminopeptidase